jgi:hypothetical protein
MTILEKDGGLFGLQRFGVRRSAFGVSAFSVRRSAFGVSAFGVRRSAFGVRRSAFRRFGVRRSAAPHLSPLTSHLSPLPSTHFCAFSRVSRALWISVRRARPKGFQHSPAFSTPPAETLHKNVADRNNEDTDQGRDVIPKNYGGPDWGQPWGQPFIYDLADS